MYGPIISVLHHLLFPCPHVSAEHTQSTINPLLVKVPKYRNHCSPPLIRSSFFSTCGITFHILFNYILPSRSSRQLFTTISDHPQSKNHDIVDTHQLPLPSPSHLKPSSFQISSPLIRSSFFHLRNQLPQSLQSHSSLQVSKTAVHHHLRSFPIQNNNLFYTR